MQSINDYVHIEDKYAGVTLGAINLPRGLIYIDAPPVPEDARSWRADLLDLKCGYERMLISLDTNIDRAIGTRAMDAPIIAHQKVAEFFESRSSTFKPQGQLTGAAWEDIPNLTNVRWSPPHMTLSERIQIHWYDNPIILEHHPGANHGAIWVILPEEKIVFVGDTVVKNQPSFFETANIPRWIEDVDLLLNSDAYQGYTVVSGRGGVCAKSTIEKQLDILQLAHKKLKKLGKKNAEAEETEKMIPALLKPLRFLASDKEAYTQRLIYGLKTYYTNHYLQEPEENEEETN